MAAARLMGLVREQCGAMVAVLDVWGRRARTVVQEAWYLIYKLQICILRMWFYMWKDSKVRKALVVSGSLVESSVAVKYIELIERHGYSLAGGAWKLVEDGENESAVLEIGEQLREYRKQ